MLRFRCPQCQTPMEVDESMAGRPARCPTCGNNLKIPKTSEAPPVAAKGQPPRPGATAVKVHGESVEVEPPLEIMAIIGPAFVGLAILMVPLCGLVLARFFGGLEWLVGFLFGTLLAFLGVTFGMSAYYNIRRSRGRKGGKLYAQVSMFGGLALAVLCGTGAIIFGASLYMRPSCEDNLNKLYVALRAYADKHDGHLPKDLEVLVREKYLDSDAALTCPAYRRPSGTQTYQLAPDIPMNDKLFPDDLMIVSDGQPYGTHSDGQVRVLTKDGKVDHVPADKFQLYQNDQKAKWEAAQKAKRKATAPAEAPAATKERAPEESAEPATEKPAPAAKAKAAPAKAKAPVPAAPEEKTE